MLQQSCRLLVQADPWRDKSRCSAVTLVQFEGSDCSFALGSNLRPSITRKNPREWAISVEKNI